MLAPFWTPEKTEKAKAMWAEGCSASTIASEIGAASRNAVVGKIHRLGRARAPGAVIEARARAKVERQSAAPRPVKTEAHMNGALAYRVSRAIRAKQLLDEAPPQELPTTELVEGFRHLSLFDLDETTCRWPDGDAPAVTFCGLHPEGDFPYCVHHCRIAYKAPERRERGTKTNHSSTGQFA